MNNSIIEVRELSKTYPGVKALKKVSFDITKATVHCVIGENGAGKSTFIKILTGAERGDGGEIRLNGKPFNPQSIQQAMQSGISVLYQELNVINQLSVRDNLSLGKEKSRLGILDRNDHAADRGVEVLGKLDDSINPDHIIGEYSVAKKQIVEIAKAIADNASIIVMDEPTAAISDSESRRLFELIDGLKKRGVTIIYISHRLDEIFRIGDYVTVFRDGEVIATKPVSEIANTAELVRMMIGKVVFQQYQQRQFEHEKTVLEVKHLQSKVLKDVSFELHNGEILGFYGLIGAGKSEIARAIFGADHTEGEIVKDGVQIKNKTPRHAVANGIVLVPEERRTEGIFGLMSIKENVNIMNLKKIIRGVVLRPKLEKEIARKNICDLQIATDSMEKRVSYLSGGNQQKVVLGKCINVDGDIIMLDEPTRGIDVGAKAEIYRIIRDLTNDGLSVMVFSSEIQEIVNLCDRIILLNQGKKVAEVQNGPALDEKYIMNCVTGG